MPTLEEIRTDIKKSLKNGVSYRKIALIYRTTAPTIKRIEQGIRIGTKTLNILNVDPSKALQATRERNETLDKIAQYWGYKHWSDYETKCLKDFKENFDFETNTWKE